MSTTFLLLMSLLPQVQGDMCDAVAARSARLDRVVLEISHEMYGVGDGSTFDRSHWIGPVDRPDPYRVTIVRPFALCEFLRDEPAVGYEPVLESVSDRGYVNQHVRPAVRTKNMRLPGTFATYTLVPNSVQSGTLKGNPLLQVLDLHLHDSTISLLTMERLLNDGTAALSHESADAATYVASVQMRGFIAHYEFELSSRGTPLRIKTVLELNENPGLLPITYEQFNLAFREINGAEFPVESIVIVENPNVQRERNIHHYTVTSIARDDSLTAADVLIEPATRSAFVHTYRPDGSLVSVCYDDAGNVLLRQEALSGPAPLDADVNYVPRKDVRWRGVIPPVAGLMGLVTLGTLLRISRRSATLPARHTRA